MIHHILSCKATSPVHHLSKDHTLSKRRKIGMFRCHLIMSKSNGSPLSKSPMLLRSLHCNLRSNKAWGVLDDQRSSRGMFVWALSTVVVGWASDPCHGLLKLVVALQIIFKNQYLLCICFPCPHWNANSLSHHTVPFLAVFFCFKPMPCSYLQWKRLWFYGLEPTIRMVHGHLWRCECLMFAYIFSTISKSRL